MLGDQQPGVLVLRVGSSTSAVGPCSTTSPSRMTSTSSQSCATTARSCETTTSASPVRSLQLGEQVEDLGLHGDVERRGRLVGDQDLRVGGDRRGDEDALQHAAGQLVRCTGRRRAPGRAGARRRSSSSARCRACAAAEPAS